MQIGGRRSGAVRRTASDGRSDENGTGFSPVVLLDEPTTGLDLQTENIVLKAESLEPLRTMVVVTHRLQAEDRLTVLS